MTYDDVYLEIDYRDIVFSKPKFDCFYCEVFSFVHFDGSLAAACYAECFCKIKHGFTSLTIMRNPNYLTDYSVDCFNCKYYKSKNQLSLNFNI